MSEDWIQRRRENDTVRELLALLERHSPGERGHADRVAVYATAAGHELGIRGDDLLHLRWAAELHDIGKMHVEAGILHTEGRLEPKQLEAMRLHAILYEESLQQSDFLAPALPSIRHHHERWDGAGYPDGLAGERIPLGARVIAVAEAFDVLTIAPTWRRSLSEEQALAELAACAGSHFDPATVDALVKVQPLIQPLGS